MKAEPDIRLIERCALGEADAWGVLVERYTKLVYSVPRRYGLPSADCDDIHQAVFANLVSNISKLKNPQALPAWLITTSHRECWRIGRVRSRILNTDSDFVSVSDPPESVVEEIEEQQLVRVGLDQLGGRCQELLLMLFGGSEKCDYEKVAVHLGIPMGSIGPTRARCLEKLGVILKKMGILRPGGADPRERRAP